MRIPILIPFIFLLLMMSCQQEPITFQKVMVSETDPDQLYINDDNSTSLYYLKYVPKTQIKGALIVLPSGGERTEDVIQQINLHVLAAKQDLITIIPSLNWGVDNRLADYQFLDQIFNEIIETYQVPKDKFVLGGLSNGGMVSIGYAQKSVKHPNSTAVKPLGIFGLDTPLDKAYLYAYCKREIERNFSQAGVNEAKWMLNNYQKLYGGSPEDFPEKYIEASLYSYGVKNGGNAYYLKNMPIRMYTDLDVDWLMNERQRDLNDWNGSDIIAMINALKIMGNPNAHVNVTMGKGIRLDGRKHPHSWSIMDNNDCMDWILSLMQNELENEYVL